MQKTSVSVIIACNSLVFLPETIKSIESQTFNHGLMEIILVLDRLDIEKAEETIDGLTDIRLKIFLSDKNGVAHATNLGLAEATGEIVAIIDSDDIMLPNRIKNQVDFLVENPNIAAVGGHIQLINADGTVIGQKKYKCSPLEIRKNVFERVQLAHPAATYRRDFVLGIGGYRDLDAPDLDLWVRILEKSDLANINETVIKYRVHDYNYSKQSVFNTNTPKKIIWISHFLRIKALAHDLPEKGKEENWIIEKVCLLKSDFVTDLALSDDWNQSREFMDLFHLLKISSISQKIIVILRILSKHKSELYNRIVLKTKRFLYKVIIYRKHKYKLPMN